MKRRSKIAIAIALAGALMVALVAGGAALASGRMHDGFAKRRVTRHIDAALDAVAANAAQRDAVHAARDHVFATLEETHRGQRGEIAQALDLWQADTLDTAKLAELRARHQAAAKKTGDAVVQALTDAHDTLTAAQRQKLADYLRAHRPPVDGKSVEGMKPFAKNMLNERVDDLLDEINARADQRDKVHAAVERAFAAVAGTVGEHAAHFDEAIAVFTADQVDSGKLQALAAERQARMQQMGDALLQALSEVHDTLDAGQRKTVADFVRKHHGRHGG
jgi:Spy/CpxP family protein refolding chaperone